MENRFVDIHCFLFVMHEFFVELIAQLQVLSQTRWNVRSILACCAVTFRNPVTENLSENSKILLSPLFPYAVHQISRVTMYYRVLTTAYDLRTPQLTDLRVYHPDLLEFDILCFQDRIGPCVQTCLLNEPTPRSRILTEKLTCPQLLKKFLAFYGIRRFITAFTRARHLSLSWARSIQSTPHPTSLTSVSILSSHLRLGLPSGLLP